ETSGDDLTPRAPLAGGLDVDVAIVGAGYTGLWTAYYLARTDPHLRIAVLEKEIAGFGASGRNGGWCSALFAASKERVAARYGRDAAVALQRELFATVDEVGKFAAEEGLDIHYEKGGTLDFATSSAHVERLREEVEEERRWGLAEAGYGWLAPAEGARRIATRRAC